MCSREESGKWDSGKWDLGHVRFGQVELGKLGEPLIVGSLSLRSVYYGVYSQVHFGVRIDCLKSGLLDHSAKD